MNKITQSLLQNSPKLLNEYYMQQYSGQMTRLNNIEVSNIFIEEEDDWIGHQDSRIQVIDEAEEIEMERREEMATQKKQKQSQDKVRSVQQEIITSLLQSKKVYSKKSPVKNKTKPVQFSPKRNQVQQQQLKESPKIQLSTKPKTPLNSIREVSQTESLFGPPRTVFSGKSKHISLISKRQDDFETQSVGEKSYYSAAVQSKITSKASLFQKSKKEKKNFKKVLLQRKYQTGNMNQSVYKSQHETELHIRQVTRPEMINFSQVCHQRQEEQEIKKQQVYLERDFKKISQSIERELNQQANWENVPEIPEGNSTLIVTRVVKQLTEDHVSMFENVNIKELESDEMEESDQEVPQESKFYQAIAEVFEERLQRSKVSPPKRKVQDQDSQQPSVAPQKYSEKSVPDQEQIQNSSVFSSEVNYGTPVKMLDSENDSKYLQSAHLQYIQTLEREKQQQEQLRQLEKIRQKQVLVYHKKQQLLGRMGSHSGSVLAQSLLRMAGLLGNQDVLLSIQESLISTTIKLLQDSEQLQSISQQKLYEMKQNRERIATLIDQNDNPVESYQYKEMEALLNHHEQILTQSKEEEERVILMNKVFIKKLVQKCCTVMEQKVALQAKSF